MQPEKHFNYALATPLERELKRYGQVIKTRAELKQEDPEGDKFTREEQAKIAIVANIQHKLRVCREGIKQMSEKDRRAEDHDSELLGDHMRAEGRSHCHDACGDERAWRLRATLAECEIGIDDAHNGCWLPASTKYTGMWSMPKSQGHLSYHTEGYETWVRKKLDLKTSETAIRMELGLIGRLLQINDLPDEASKNK